MSDGRFTKGSKPGPGRPKGTKNKATSEREARIAALGITPLDYLMSIVADETASLEDRKDAAKAAAPYVHPKLSSVEVSGPEGGPIEHAVDVSGLSDAALREIAALVGNK
jgi:hypothetical protein